MKTFSQAVSAYAEARGLTRHQAIVEYGASAEGRQHYARENPIGNTEGSFSSGQRTFFARANHHRFDTGPVDDYGAQREFDTDRDTREKRLADAATWLREHGFGAQRALLIAGAMIDGGAMPALSLSERDTVSQVPVGNSAPPTNSNQRDGSGGAYRPIAPSGRAPVAGMPNSARQRMSRDLGDRIDDLERELDQYGAYRVVEAFNRSNRK